MDRRPEAAGPPPHADLATQGHPTVRKSRIVLVRKCAPQSTSMPALHRRNVPNCRPMADGGMRKCSAGACPPLGSGWGVAESAVPIRCTKPQLRLFMPWCAGASRHERLVRKHVPDPLSGTEFRHWLGETNQRRPNNDSPGSQEKCMHWGSSPARGGGHRRQLTLPSTHMRPKFSYLGVPAPAGTSDSYESMSRASIRDRLRHRLSTPVSVTRRSQASLRRKPESRGEWQDLHPMGRIPRPLFHPLTWSSQRHT